MTTREKEILAFIIRYKQSHDGNSPSIREICAGVGISSTSHALYCLHGLERMGHITINSQRQICVNGGKWAME